MSNLNLAIIIRLLLKESNLDEASLCRQTGIPKSTLNRILKEETNPTIETLLPISNFFNITISQLIGEEELPRERLPGTHYLVPYTSTRIPVLTLKNLENYLINNRADSSVWISTEKELCENSFAINIKTNEFELFFKKNSIVIINNISDTSKIQYGDIILIKKHMNSNPTLKQVVIEDETIYTRSLNSNINKLEQVLESDQILGIVVESRTEYAEDKFSKRLENPELSLNHLTDVLLNN